MATQLEPRLHLHRQSRMSTWSRLVFEEKRVGIPGVHSLGQYNYVAARAGLPPHQHLGCVEISLLVKGNQAYQVGGTVFHVKGGEQYISRPGEMHDTGDQPQDKGILYWLILDVTKDPDNFLFLAPSMARKLISDLLAFPSRHFAADQEGHATLDRAFNALLQIRRPDECTGIFAKPAATQVKPRPSGKQKLNARETFHLLEASSHIVYYILQTIAASRANTRPSSPVIEDSLAFIAGKQEEWLSVAQVAEHVHLSESYFKILFRERVGLPPAEFMLRKKVEAAKTTLADSDCNITELAYRLGFSSSQYFATVFKRFTNQTPSEYMHGHVADLVKIG